MIVHRNPETVKSVVQAREVVELLTKATTESLGVEVEHRAVDGDPYAVRVALAKEESVGAIVAPMRQRGLLRPYASIPKVLNALSPAQVPVLLTNGEPRFEQIIAPARRTISGDSAGRAAIDIARRSGSKVVGVAVANPTFMGRDDLREKRNATSWLRREASVQDVHVERHVVRGNPVKVIAEVTGPDKLLVVSMPSGHVSRWSPGIAVWAAARAAGSVLFVPVAR